MNFQLEQLSEDKSGSSSPTPNSPTDKGNSQAPPFVLATTPDEHYAYGLVCLLQLTITLIRRSIYFQFDILVDSEKEIIQTLNFDLNLQLSDSVIQMIIDELKAKGGGHNIFFFATFRFRD